MAWLSSSAALPRQLKQPLFGEPFVDVHDILACRETVVRRDEDAPCLADDLHRPAQKIVDLPEVSTAEFDDFSLPGRGVAGYEPGVEETVGQVLDSVHAIEDNRRQVTGLMES